MFNWARRTAVCLALAAGTLALYWSVTRCEFIHFDDPQYVTENPVVTQGLHWRGVVWAFGTGEQSNWHPLTWLSHMLDVQLFGLRASAHHLVNVGFHVANTLLLFLVLLRLTGATWRCLFVAALFALHPLHVESVAWVAERKDVLSTFFGLLALGAYVQYAKTPEGQGPKARVAVKTCAHRSSCDSRPASRFTVHVSSPYFLSLLLFAGSLLSKPTLVTLPLLLLLLDFWPLNRLQGKSLRSVVLEKLPFLALSTGSCVITLLVQREGGALRTADYLPLGARLTNAAIGYTSYLQKAFWPGGLAVFYPLPLDRPGWQGLVAAALLVAITLGVVLARRRYLLVGWLWFLGMLVPMIGLVQVGEQAIADRYTYLPLVGLFLGVAWGLYELWPRGAARAFALGLGALAVLGCCAGLSWRQLAVWRNTETLMRHALAVTKNNYVALNNLGDFYQSRDQLQPAIECFRQSLALRLRLETISNLGTALGRQRDYAGALPLFEKAVAYWPEEVGVRNNYAVFLALSGRPDDAIAQYRLSLSLSNSPVTRHELGHAYLTKGQVKEAVEEFAWAVRLDPSFDEARNCLAIGLDRAGRRDEAITQYQALLRAHPDDPATLNNLGLALKNQGKPDEAIQTFRHVLRRSPDNPSALINLAMVLAVQHKLPEAIEGFRKYTRLRPDDIGGHQCLGQALFEADKFDEAIPEFDAALRLSPANPEPHFYLGLIAQERGELDEAILEFNRSINLFPNNPEVHFRLGAALHTQGKTDQAAKQFTETLRLQPDHPEAGRALEALRSSTNSIAPAPPQPPTKNP